VSLVGLSASVAVVKVLNSTLGSTNGLLHRLTDEIRLIRGVEIMAAASLERDNVAATYVFQRNGHLNHHLLLIPRTLWLGN